MQKYIRCLQTEIQWNDNRTEITVKIKADAKWNDGTPVTAKDVAATYHAHVDYNSSTGAEMKSYIADVVAQDDSTVVFKLTTDDLAKQLTWFLRKDIFQCFISCRKTI